MFYHVLSLSLCIHSQVMLCFPEMSEELNLLLLNIFRHFWNSSDLESGSVGSIGSRYKWIQK